MFEKLKKQEQRDAIEKLARENRTILAIIKDSKVFLGVTQYLAFKEYHCLAGVNKRMHLELRQSVGAHACINYIKSKFVVQQPLFSVSYKPQMKVRAGGGGISAKFTPQTGTLGMGPPSIMVQSEMSFDNHESKLTSQPRGGALESSFQSHNSSMVSMDMNNQSMVSQSDIQKLSNNERVKFAIQRYVNEDQKVASETEFALQKAQQLLLSYACLVFSEHDIEQMKQQSLMMNNSPSMQADLMLLSQSQDMSIEENKSHDLGNMVKNSLKTGFGSIIGIFGD